jgi:hypothetical protein
MIRHAWHFLNADWTTSSGNILVKVGEPLIHVGDLVPCRSGLHASARAIDALSFARGPVVTLVECDGEFVDHGTPADKFICRKRTALWGYDSTDELWTFARLAALETLHLWPDAPAVVREFLETGDEDLRAAARAAAWAAARAAAWAAARAAAWDAAWDAARDAARAAAWDAALSRSNEILESLLIDGAVSRGLVLP